MKRFDDLAETQLRSAQTTTNRLLLDNQVLNQKVGASLQTHKSQLVEIVDKHGKAVLEAERSAISQMRDTVGASLKSFSDSVWRGVHSMAQSIQLPSYPVFTCYYCKQKFSITERERIGENDYCPEHGQKRKAMFQASTHTEVVEHDNRTRLHSASSGSQQSDNDKLPWLG
jgi:hypothetical protein